MKMMLLRTVAVLVTATTSLWATETQSEVERYVASIRSVGDAKSRLLAHLNPECGTGSCADNNAGEVCNLVAALDIRAGGVITAPGQPVQPSNIAITGTDLQLMRRIWRQCRPTSHGYWNRAELLRVTYQGDDKEVAELSSALRAAVKLSRTDAGSNQTMSPNEDKALSNCLTDQAQRGTYSSLDGGRSAVSMLKVCHTPVQGWLNSCIARGESQDSCTQKVLILGQVALKLVGK